MENKKLIVTHQDKIKLILNKLIKINNSPIKLHKPGKPLFVINNINKHKLNTGIKNTKPEQ